MATITLIGADELIRLFARSDSPRTMPAVAQAVMEEAQIAFRNSQRIVPVDKSPLKQSGMILPPKISGTRVTVELGYGGAASAYAMRQHEDMTYLHKSGKSAKYLENPVRDRIPNLEQRLYRRLQRILSQ